MTADNDNQQPVAGQMQLAEYARLLEHINAAALSFETSADVSHAWHTYYTIMALMVTAQEIAATTTRPELFSELHNYLAGRGPRPRETMQ